MTAEERPDALGPVDLEAARSRIAGLRVALETDLPTGHDYRTGIEAVCGLALELLPISGAVVSLMTATEAGDLKDTTVVAAANEWSIDVEDIEMMTGEGPGRDAFRTYRPVLTADLEHSVRWPGYASAGLAAGLCASWAFPLGLGAARLGVLHLLDRRTRVLTPAQMSICLLLADAATSAVLGTDLAVALAAGTTEARPGTRDTIYQAQGMVSAALGISLTEAMARLRAFAFARELDLHEVAAAVLTGRTPLTRTPSGPAPGPRGDPADEAGPPPD